MELYERVLEHLADIGEAQSYEEKCRLKGRDLRQGGFEFAGTR